MIKVFLKEYALWLIGVLVMLSAFLLTFVLYHLPLRYFIVSLMFSVTLWLSIILCLFYSFSRKMAVLKEGDIYSYQDILNKPSDQAYLEVMEEQASDYKDKILAYKQKEHDLEAMVKMWSHQMKVPISALSLMSQTNRLEQAEVEQQLARLQNYLDTLLNYLKFSQNKDDFRFELVSAREVITNIVKKYRMSCLAKNLSVTIDGDWQLKTDKKWLSFALSQIIDNAIKYSTEGGRVTIEIKEKSIEISDSGIGILDEDLPRIFEEGFTGYNGHEHQKATGLGLYMTKQVLKQLLLAISLTSQVGKGTQVTISVQD